MRILGHDKYDSIAVADAFLDIFLRQQPLLGARSPSKATTDLSLIAKIVWPSVLSGPERFFAALQISLPVLSFVRINMPARKL